MIYRLTSSIHNIQPDDPVLLQSDDGEVLGRVVFVSSERMEKVPQERLYNGRYSRIIRIANERDKKFFVSREEREQRAKLFCRQKIREMKLPMKLSRTTVQTNGKIVFHFTAENRVDFRELVRTLGSYLKTRVEMRHVGVRDETRLLGGLGPCGKTFCCSQYLKKFHPVSVRMAKNQDLSLNPDGISGICGRLLCCLAYENDVYQDRRANLPKPKSRLWTQDGREGTVRTVHTLAETVDMQFGDGTREQFSACDLCKSKPDPKKIAALTNNGIPFLSTKIKPQPKTVVKEIKEITDIGSLPGEPKTKADNSAPGSRKKESEGRSRSRRGSRRRDRSRAGKGREGGRGKGGEGSSDDNAGKPGASPQAAGEKKGRSQRGKKQRQAAENRSGDPQQQPPSPPKESTGKEAKKTANGADGEAPTSKPRRRRRRRSRGSQQGAQSNNPGSANSPGGGHHSLERNRLTPQPNHHRRRTKQPPDNITGNKK